MISRLSIFELLTYTTMSAVSNDVVNGRLKMHKIMHKIVGKNVIPL